MSALTRDRATPYREGVEVEYPVAIGAIIYAGSLVCTNADGYAVPASDTSGLRLAGVSLEQVNHSRSMQHGYSTMVRLRRQGLFEFNAVNITQAMVGDPMYAVDDHTFGSAAEQTNDIKVGKLIKYSSPTKGWIDIKT